VNSHPPSYTTIEVAKRLGVSLQTVQRWVDAGHLKAWKTLGGHRRIEASGAELLFKAQQERIGPAPPVPLRPMAGAAAVPVVVVDDDPRDLALMVALVEKALPAARVETAVNGFQGLVVIGRVAPVIVVTDIHMPHMDGLEMLRNLMLDAATRPRLLLAVSAQPNVEAALGGPVPEGVVFVSKPLVHDHFIGVLRSAV